MDDGVFNGLSHEKDTLFVYRGVRETYRSTPQWNAFKNILAFPPVIINDGDAYTKKDEEIADSLVYTRKFDNTNFKALFIPFSIKVEEVEEEMDIYELQNVFEEDKYDDGVVDNWYLRIIKLKAGDSTRANMPYVIKPKITGNISILFKNKMLYTSNVKDDSIRCESVRYQFVFKGTYDTISMNDDTHPYFAISPTGGLQFTTGEDVILKPQRWYMKIRNKETGQIVKPSTFNPKHSNNMGGVTMMRNGDEAFLSINSDEFTLPIQGNSDVAIYDLQGRRYPNIESVPVHTPFVIGGEKRMK